MLDFYGMHLVDETTGSIQRTANFTPRYYNLVTYRHNFLRITRILKCLGEVGLERLKYPWLKFFVDEVVSGQLTETLQSLQFYWIPMLRDEARRAQLLDELKTWEESRSPNDDNDSGIDGPPSPLDMEDNGDTPGPGDTHNPIGDRKAESDVIVEAPTDPQPETQSRKRKTTEEVDSGY
eukprot:c2921_g1_i2.p1 GENE.c2921_g1_i2~~c2921_g1_i2.p1  ORF type:complete len:179 (-),score=30.68 c2921_g1_i2:116-652(-)